MSSIRNLLCAALAAAVLLSAPSAEARFGKHSSSSSSSEQKSQSDAPRAAATAGRPRVRGFLADLVLTLLVETRPVVYARRLLLLPPPQPESQPRLLRRLSQILRPTWRGPGLGRSPPPACGWEWMARP